MSMPAGIGAARLLVVDDQELNRDMLSRRLAQQGYRVDMAESGEQALAMLGTDPYDLVLLDIMMPLMDGYEVLSRIKRDAALRDIPVVMVSAVGETESVVKCLELGADDYLTKPFNALVLRARVNASLAKKWLHDREQLYARSLARELEIGREIQAGFLPQSCPQPDGWEIAARFEPARSVSGDFYDAFALENGHVALVTADVCDKGVGAALYMALFRTLLRAMASRDSGLGRSDADVLIDVLGHTNDYIATTHERANMFATVFVGILDPASGALRFVNAGHDLPVIAARGAVRELLATTGPALGLTTGARFTVGNAHLQPGEMLLAYTDGAIDARRAQDAAPFSEERMYALFEGAETAAALLERICGALDEHVGSGERFDDVTLLAVRRHGADEAPGRER
jgi:serine phosphatase RsbU (regulator of sigma subunit)